MASTSDSSCNTSTGPKKYPNGEIISHCQAPIKTIGQHFKELLTNIKYTDINFLVGKETERQQFSAHKIILAARSTVFEAMFFGPLATKSKNVIIPDIEPAAFIALLRYVYSDEIKIDMDTVMSILYTARKYDLPGLEQNCVNFLKNCLGSESAFLILNNALLFDIPQLAAVCLGVLDRDISNEVADESFIEVDLNTLITVLERDTLQIYESQLFQAIHSWSIAECERRHLPLTVKNQRRVLGRSLTLIRFSLMTLKEFINGPTQSGLLDDSEIKNICIEIASHSNSTEIPRCIKNQQESRFIYSMESKTSDIAYSEFQDSFIFKKPIFVVGFIALINSSVHNFARARWIIENGPENLNRCVSRPLCLEKVSFMFERPFMIMPKTKYVVDFKLDRPHVFQNMWQRCTPAVLWKYGCNGEILQEKYAFDYISFANSFGIISEIIFYE